jgi:1,2-dihydroxy-3-keto-5-methylthiopentene dioxygenase
MLSNYTAKSQKQYKWGREQSVGLLEYRGNTFTDPERIRTILAQNGVPYERWGTKNAEDAPDSEVLNQYAPEVAKLQKDRGYVTADLVALSSQTPNLSAICAKFDKEHHHSDDEVRFTVAGSGVFEIQAKDTKDFLKFTAEAGDLIVIPAMRRHSFYLTAKTYIRCIRLFKDQSGWEAIYDQPNSK